MLDADGDIEINTTGPKTQPRYKEQQPKTRKTFDSMRSSPKTAVSEANHHKNYINDRVVMGKPHLNALLEMKNRIDMLSIDKSEGTNTRKSLNRSVNGRPELLPAAFSRQ